MARRENVNSEPYNAYLSSKQIPQAKPENSFYTVDSAEVCNRYFCAACGGCHPMNACPSNRLVEHITGTSLPDAAFHASEAYVIDDYIQRRFKDERRKLRNEHHCKPTASFPFPKDKEEKNPGASRSC